MDNFVSITNICFIIFIPHVILNVLFKIITFKRKFSQTSKSSCEFVKLLMFLKDPTPYFLKG